MYLRFKRQPEKYVQKGQSLLFLEVLVVRNKQLD